jgi:hypothetical protein
MGDSIDQYMKRPKLYANIEGTTEAAVGVFMLGGVLTGYLEDFVLQHVKLSYFPHLVFLYLAYTPILCLIYFGPKAVKKYITYPRTGYVAYLPPRASNRAVVFAASAITAAIIVGLVAFQSRHAAVTPLRFAIAAGLGICYSAPVVMFARTERWKWIVYGPLAVGLVAIMLTSGERLRDALRPMLLLAGCTYFASGAATFWLYMRRTQPPAPECE